MYLKTSKTIPLLTFKRSYLNVYFTCQKDNVEIVSLLGNLICLHEIIQKYLDTIIQN